MTSSVSFDGRGHMGARLVSVEHKTILLHTVLSKGNGKFHHKQATKAKMGSRGRAVIFL
jgi:hypothetical protein